MALSFPLTAIEEFLFWEDRPAYPWSCFLRFRFSGQLDRDAFESAVTVALDRHPLLRSKIKKRRFGRLWWEVVDQAQPSIRWRTGSAEDGFPTATHLSLFDEIGIRFDVVADASRSDLVIQWHHACCDGAGIFLFVHDLLIAYALAQGKHPGRLEFPVLDPNRLRQRGKYGLTVSKFLRMLPKQLTGLGGVRQYLTRSAAPIVPHEIRPDDEPPPEGYPAVRSWTFNAEETARLRKAAKGRQVTMNDLMARDLFLALATFRSGQNLADDRWLRMMVPMNLRSTDDRRLSAANVVSLVFLDRRDADYGDEERLLQSIHEQMDLIKRLHLGLTFVFSSYVCRYLPGGLKRRVRQGKSDISCIFTNLGRVLAHSPLLKNSGRLVSGNATLERIEAAAPIRPNLCASFAVYTYARELTVNLHYDPRVISSEQATCLLDAFVQRTRTSIQANHAT